MKDSLLDDLLKEVIAPLSARLLALQAQYATIPNFVARVLAKDVDALRATIDGLQNAFSEEIVNSTAKTGESIDKLEGRVTGLWDGHNAFQNSVVSTLDKLIGDLGAAAERLKALEDKPDPEPVIVVDPSLKLSIEEVQTASKDAVASLQKTIEGISRQLEEAAKSNSPVDVSALIKALPDHTETFVKLGGTVSALSEQVKALAESSAALVDQRFNEAVERAGQLAEQAADKAAAGVPAAVAPIAAAVRELTESMPQRFEASQQTIWQKVDETIKTLVESLPEVVKEHAPAVELPEPFNPTPLVEQIGDVEKRLTDAFAASIEAMEKRLLEHIEKSVGAMRENLLGSMEAVKNSIPVLPTPFDANAFVSGVVQPLLAHHAEGVEKQIETVNQNLVAAVGENATMLVNMFDKRLSAASEQLAASIDATNGAVEDLRGSVTNDHDTLERVTLVVSELEKAEPPAPVDTTFFVESVKSTVELINRVEESTNAQLKTLHESVQSLQNIEAPEPFNPTPIIEQIDTVRRDLGTAIEEMHREVNETIAQVKSAIPAPIELPAMPEPFNPTPIVELIDAAVAATRALSEDVADKLAAVHKTIEETKAAIQPMPAPYDDSTIKNDVQQLVEKLNTIHGELQTAVTETDKHFRQLLDEVKSAIPELPEPFNPTPVVEQLQSEIAKSKGDLESAIVEAVKANSESVMTAVAERFASVDKAITAIDIPDQFDPAPLLDQMISFTNMSSEQKEQLEALRQQMDETGHAVEEVAALVRKSAPLELVEEIRTATGITMKGTLQQIHEAIERIQVDFTVPDFRIEEVDGALYVRGYNAEGKAQVDVRLPGFNYRDVYNPATKYAAGDAVTYGGCMWVAKRNEPGRIKEDLTGWKMVVKGGSNGTKGEDGASIGVYDGHEDGRVYRKGDFLHQHGRVWWCRVGTRSAPEGAQVKSSAEWALLGKVH